MRSNLKYFFLGLVVGSSAIYLALKPVDKGIEITQSTPNNALITGYEFPSEVDLFGEQVPLHRPDIAERLDREIQVNAFWHSNTILTIKRAHKWLPLFDSILVAQGIPSDFKYLAVIESGLQNVISPKKAVGFWQFLKGTAKDYGLEVSSTVDERYDPLRSTIAACKYLKDGYERFGNWTIVAASYNTGMNGMDEALGKQNVDSYYDLKLGDEPARYVFRLIALRTILQDPGTFGFHVPKHALYTQQPTRITHVTEDIGNLVGFAESHGITYQTLKRFNPWMRAFNLKVRPGKIYNIRVPEGS